MKLVYPEQEKLGALGYEQHQSPSQPATHNSWSRGFRAGFGTMLSLVLCLMVAIRLVQTYRGAQVPSLANQPPKLTIHSAYYADMDVTSIWQARISDEQTLTIDTSVNLHDPDPWYLVSKTLSIVYSYDNGPLQLFVTREASGTSYIRPHGPTFPIPYAIPSDLPMKTEGGYKNTAREIVGVVWGASIVRDANTVYRMFVGEGGAVCSNQNFGFDGYHDWQKTCQVFYREVGSDIVHCAAAREGSKLTLES